ncbi:MAG: NAD(+)/NADH kinase [Candidatus Cloacimonetes bacterium]|nr:NAD(+)/NADH kinase [Candidatus Cloacimonadota bacterium]
MKNFGLVMNHHYKEIHLVFHLLENLHRNKDINLYFFSDQEGTFPIFIKQYYPQKSEKLDCILVFGGDGTFLRAIDISLAMNAPLLGINLGKLGFLSESSLKELEKSIDNLKKNRFKVQARMLLKVSLRRQGETLLSYLALNDAVINKGQSPKLIDIRVSSNNRFVVQTRCDGIIVASPTGSTAYSLSAGGPIISPVMDAIVLTPLNPHVLTVRPMVFAAADIIKLRFLNGNEQSYLQLDGQNKHLLQQQDEIIITAASQKVNFIKLTNKTFFQILRKKFHMGKK